MGEALIMTAFGLAVAIPAVLSYSGTGPTARSQGSSTVLCAPIEAACSDGDEFYFERHGGGDRGHDFYPAMPGVDHRLDLHKTELLQLRNVPRDSAAVALGGSGQLLDRSVPGGSKA